MICFCTCALNNDIKCWASTLSRRVKKKEVVACTKTAAPTIINIRYNKDESALVITSSIKYLLAPGKTNPDRRLIIIRNKPRNKSFFLGQIMFIKTYLMLDNDIFFDFLSLFFWFIGITFCTYYYLSWCRIALL